MLGEGNKNNGSTSLGKCKFPHKKDYEADMAEGLFHPANFGDVPVRKQRVVTNNDNLMEQDLTTGCWATATLKAELIIIMERVTNIV